MRLWWASAFAVVTSAFRPVVSVIAVALGLLSVQPALAQFFTCPAGSRAVSSGYQTMCQCPDGSFAGISGCHGGYGGSNIPRGSISCGGGRFCPAGTECASQNKCMPAGSVDCGNGKSCPQDTKCALSGSGCLAQDAVDCGSYACKSGSKCSSGGICLPQDVADCGGGKFCGSGLVCIGTDKCGTQQQADAIRAAEQKVKQEAARAAAEEKRLKAEQQQAERERIKKEDEERKLALKTQLQQKLKEAQEKKEAAVRAEVERKRQAEEARQAAIKAKEVERQRVAEEKRLEIERKRQAAVQAEVERKRQAEEQRLAAAKAEEAERQRIAEVKRQEAERKKQASLPSTVAVQSTSATPIPPPVTITKTDSQSKPQTTVVAVPPGTPSNTSATPQTTIVASPPVAPAATTSAAPPQNTAVSVAPPPASVPPSTYTFAQTQYGTVEIFQNGQRIATSTPQYAVQQYGYQLPGGQPSPSPQPAAATITSGNVSTPSMPQPPQAASQASAVRTVTLPNGAVVGIDAAGNIVSGDATAGRGQMVSPAPLGPAGLVAPTATATIPAPPTASQAGAPCTGYASFDNTSSSSGTTCGNTGTGSFSATNVPTPPAIVPAGTSTTVPASTNNKVTPPVTNIQPTKTVALQPGAGTSTNSPAVVSPPVTPAAAKVTSSGASTFAEPAQPGQWQSVETTQQSAMATALANAQLVADKISKANADGLQAVAADPDFRKAVSDLKEYLSVTDSTALAVLKRTGSAQTAVIASVLAGEFTDLKTTYNDFRGAPAQVLLDKLGTKVAEKLVSEASGGSAELPPRPAIVDDAAKVGARFILAYENGFLDSIAPNGFKPASNNR